MAVDDSYAWNPSLVWEEGQDEDDDDNVTVYKELLEEWERFLEDTTKIVIPKRLYQNSTNDNDDDDDDEEESSIVEECRNLYESQEILGRELERVDQVFRRHDWSEDDDKVDGFDMNDTASVVSFASSCCQLVNQEQQQQPHEPFKEIRHYHNNNKSNKSNKSKNRFAICEISIPSLVPLSSPCSTISTTTSMMDDQNLDDDMDLCLQPSFELALVNDGFQPRRNLRKLFLSSSSSSSSISLERPTPPPPPPPPPPPCAPPPPPPQDNRQQQHDSFSLPKDTVQINSEWNNKDFDTTRHVGVFEPTNDKKRQKRPGFVRSFVSEILFGPPPPPTTTTRSSQKRHVDENVCHDKQQVVDDNDDEQDESMSLITLTVAATLLWLPLTIEICCR